MIFLWKTVLLQRLQFNVRTVSMSKTVLFQSVELNIRTQLSSIWPIDRTLSGAIFLGQSGLRSDGNDGVLCIFESSCITGTSPSDCLVSSHDTRWWGFFYSSTEMQSVYWHPLIMLYNILTWFCLVSLFYGISTFVGYLMPRLFS